MDVYQELIRKEYKMALSMDKTVPHRCDGFAASCAASWLPGAQAATNPGSELFEVAFHELLSCSEQCSFLEESVLFFLLNWHSHQPAV